MVFLVAVVLTGPLNYLCLQYSQAALHLRLLESPRRRQLQAFIHQGLLAGVLNQLAWYSFDICMGTFMALFQVSYSVYL